MDNLVIRWRKGMVRCGGEGGCELERGYKMYKREVILGVEGHLWIRRITTGLFSSTNDLFSISTGCISSTTWLLTGLLAITTICRSISTG